MAQLHGDGRVLPKWPAANVGGLVCGTFAALVSRGHRGKYAGDGACDSLDALSAQASAVHLLLRRYSVGDWRNSYGQLHVPELSGAHARLSAARRSKRALAAA